MKNIEINPFYFNEYREEKITFEELAHFHNVSRPTLTKYFKESKLKTNKVLKREKINHNYFDIIESPIQAYLLGYFVADGCITLKNNKYSILKSVQFSCSEKDIELLELVQKQFNLDTKIYKGKEYNIKNTSYISNPMCSIIFVSENLFNKLSLLGYGERKTYLDYGLPNIDKDLLKYFILGYFDGDGSIIISEGIRKNNYKYKNIRFQITSHNIFFLNQIKEWFIEQNINSTVKKIKNSYDLVITNKKDIIKIRNLFYDTKLGLKRKKNKLFNLGE